MDWLFMYDCWFGDLSRLAGPASGIDYERCVQPTLIDLWLIQIAYEVLVAESTCEKCGAPLGRGLHVVEPPKYQLSKWQVSVVTRCQGWRRHRHFADIAETSSDLLLGPLHRS